MYRSFNTVLFSITNRLHNRYYSDLCNFSILTKLRFHNFRFRYIGSKRLRLNIIQIDIIIAMPSRELFQNIRFSNSFVNSTIYLYHCSIQAEQPFIKDWRISIDYFRKESGYSHQYEVRGVRKFLWVSLIGETNCTVQLKCVNLWRRAVQPV